MQSVNNVTVMRRAYIIIAFLVTSVNIILYVTINVNDAQKSNTIDFLATIELGTCCVLFVLNFSVLILFIKLLIYYVRVMRATLLAEYILWSIKDSIVSTFP